MCSRPTADGYDDCGGNVPASRVSSSGRDANDDRRNKGKGRGGSRQRREKRRGIRELEEEPQWSASNDV